MIEQETVFDKILSGEIPCHKVYEDDQVLAFLDIGPLSRGHTLVIPKERKAFLHELSDEAAAALGRVLPRLCRAVLEATGSPKALGAYIENFLGPKVTSDWMRDYTARYHERCREWIEGRTGQKLGTDHAAWRRWFRENEGKLVYSSRAGRFRIDAKGAKAYRERIGKARRKS